MSIRRFAAALRAVTDLTMDWVVPDTDTNQ